MQFPQITPIFADELQAGKQPEQGRLLIKIAEFLCRQEYDG